MDPVDLRATNADDGTSPPRHIEVFLEEWPGSPAAEPTQAAPAKLMTAQEAANFLGVHKNTVYLAAASGDLRCHKIGRLLRFREADLLAWTGGWS
jgi:excisionase family DNA binding protein